MLELLLISACITGNSNSCESSLNAYGKYSGYEQKIEKFGKKYPMLAYTTGIIGLYRNKKIYWKIHSNWYHDLQFENASMKNTIIYRFDF